MIKKFGFLALVLVVIWGSFQVIRPAFFETPILMYHLVDYAHPNSSSPTVTPETFEAQMQFLKVHRYHVRPLAQVIAELKAGKKIKPRTVCITFDDGTEDNFKHAFPILKKLNLPATIFMITGNIGKPGWLSEKQLKILDESGVSIGSHTVTHAYLPQLSEDAIKRELTDSKVELERILGHPVTLFSYPAGGTTPEVRAMVQSAGYEGAVTTNYGRVVHDFYGLHRIKVSESNNLFNIGVKVSGLYHLGKKRVSYKPGSDHAGYAMK